MNTRTKTRRRLVVETLEDRRLLSGAGSLDPNFGTGGIVTTSFTSKGIDSPAAVLVQADGKLVAFGTGMARYNGDGSLDASFGSGGKVTSASGNGAALYPAGAPGAGKIVTAGSASGKKTGSDFSLTRYNANGSVDTSFGTRGVVTTDLGGSESARAVAVQPDGKVVVAGDYRTSSGTLHQGFALARYNADGSLDTSFGTGGKVVTSLWASDLHGLALQADGRIVVVARAAASVGQDYHFAVARYNANGTLDAGFGPAHTGLVLVIDMLADHPGVTPIPGWYSDTLAYEANGVAVQADGKLVAVGTTYGNSNGEGWLVARFDTAGNLDATFGIRGTTYVKPSTDPNLWDQARAVAVQADGQVVVTGGTDNATKFYVGRFDTAGNLDGTFGSGGLVATSIGTGGNQSYGLAIQPDGKIVAVGTALVGSSVDFALARYLSSATSSPGSLSSSAGLVSRLAVAGSASQAGAGSAPQTPLPAINKVVGWRQRPALAAAWAPRAAISRGEGPSRLGRVSQLVGQRQRPL